MRSPWARTLWIAAAIVGLAAPQLRAEELVPPGVKTQPTELGVVFADPSGMTLYTRTLDDAMRGVSQCTKKVNWTATGGGAQWPVPANDKRKSCEEKNPPFKAGPDDKPVGKWSVVTRSDESFQWAYDGRPVYMSNRDHRPGDINAATIISGRQRTSSSRPLFVPTRMPAGFETTYTMAGLVLAMGESKQLLYTSDEIIKGARCAKACEAGWLPVLAPEGVAAQGGDWSVMQRADKRRQWVFRGQPLYLPDPEGAKAVEVASLAVVMPGARSGKSPWRPVIFKPAAGNPDALKTAFTLQGHAFANLEGKSLYTYYCTEESAERTGCDQVGDAAAYRSSLCGTGEECARRWRPYVAAPDAKPSGLWSIVDVPDPPFLDPKGRIGEGVPTVRGWAYAGRPVYTYFEDEQPGDITGDSIRGDYNSSGFYLVTVPGEVNDGF